MPSKYGSTDEIYGSFILPPDMRFRGYSDSVVAGVWSKKYSEKLCFSYDLARDDLYFLTCDKVVS